ncbi:hypothetical protein GCM10012290_26010 [Halolactibacillus alkaliphilus]|uniref:Uncharacterized protein n=1 Tax=Halolactibacillus alkaliphilus TaxID=442899 RepID=A0A511X538_9BACI|nr:hypothetical protein [Halolactibacillus alkaliphilus]GEN58041.1 hypothetical protein HAL01_25050 [Halolactibacillus alkaliphilus]GGN76359.1 hypothetical protein GCM10012290_26010 [Halolactibacillus alkaliphilus]SFP12407.1 hypothetical protein SAMN05720591_1548 [Halolactibacillus alkaliphilus]
METATNLLSLITKYMEQSTQPLGFWDGFLKYGIPIIQTVILLGGALAGLYKYYSVKNKEINEQMLKDVYAPLYQYFIKQELYCYINKIDRDYKESPILELTNTKRNEKTYFGEKTKTEVTVLEETLLNLNRNEFLSILDSVNIGLASKELLTLLNMYKVLIYHELKADKTSDRFLDATIMKVDIENAIRKEVIIGYLHYHKKLKLDTITTNEFHQITGDKIEFNYKVDQSVKERLRDDILNNPDKY